MATSKKKEAGKVTLQAPHKSAGSVGTGKGHELDEEGCVTLDLVKDSELINELVNGHGFKEV